MVSFVDIMVLYEQQSWWLAWVKEFWKRLKWCCSEIASHDNQPKKKIRLNGAIQDANWCIFVGTGWNGIQKPWVIPSTNGKVTVVDLKMRMFLLKKSRGPAERRYLFFFTNNAFVQPSKQMIFLGFGVEILPSKISPEVPSGKLTQLLKMAIIVELPIKKVIFHSYPPKVIFYWYLQ